MTTPGKADGYTRRWPTDGAARNRTCGSCAPWCSCFVTVGWCSSGPPTLPHRHRLPGAHPGVGVRSPRHPARAGDDTLSPAWSVSSCPAGSATPSSTGRRISRRCSSGSESVCSSWCVPPRAGRGRPVHLLPVLMDPTPAAQRPNPPTVTRCDRRRRPRSRRSRPIGPGRARAEPTRPAGRPRIWSVGPCRPPPRGSRTWSRWSCSPCSAPAVCGSPPRGMPLGWP